MKSQTVPPCHQVLPPEKQLGERGSSLSGGQRQRLAIARAIARGPTPSSFEHGVCVILEFWRETSTKSKNVCTIFNSFVVLCHFGPVTLTRSRCLNGAAGAPVLLMDEPTSALDGESEEAIAQTLTQLARDGHAVLAPWEPNRWWFYDYFMLMEKNTIFSFCSC